MFASDLVRRMGWAGQPLPGVGFTLDLAALDAVVDELREFVDWPIRHPVKIVFSSSALWLKIVLRAVF
jgi:hypothetical protein